MEKNQANPNPVTLKITATALFAALLAQEVQAREIPVTRRGTAGQGPSERKVACPHGCWVVPAPLNLEICRATPDFARSPIARISFARLPCFALFWKRQLGTGFPHATTRGIAHCPASSS